MDIEKLISSKEAALAQARAQVALLEDQIATLHATRELEQPTEYERFLGAEPTLRELIAIHKSNAARPVTDNLSGDVSSTNTRNRKGLVKHILLQVLSQHDDQPLSDVVDKVNAMADRPVSNQQTRQTLMLLRKDGSVISSKKGVYRLS